MLTVVMKSNGSAVSVALCVCKYAKEIFDPVFSWNYKNFLANVCKYSVNIWMPRHVLGSASSRHDRVFISSDYKFCVKDRWLKQ